MYFYFRLFLFNTDQSRYCIGKLFDTCVFVARKYCDSQFRHTIFCTCICKCAFIQTGPPRPPPRTTTQNSRYIYVSPLPNSNTSIKKKKQRWEKLSKKVHPKVHPKVPTTVVGRVQQVTHVHGRQKSKRRNCPLLPLPTQLP